MSSLLTDIKRFFGFIDDEEGEQVVADSTTRDASMSKRPFKGSLVHSQNARPFGSPVNITQRISFILLA